MVIANGTAPIAGSTSLYAVEVSGVGRSFKGRPALRDVDLTLAPGRIHALLGPNGAGKTTFIRILVGGVRQDAGDVRILDTDIAELPRRRLAGAMAWIPSGDRTLYHRISGFENLLFFGRVAGLRRAEAAARAQRCLREVGLIDAASKRVDAYSHGMQKLLSAARALLIDPPVLLVDEATHDLDPLGARRIRDLIKQRAQAGTAVLWTTQRVEEIRGFADDVTVLDEGAVRFAGTVPEFLSRAAGRGYLLRLRDGTADGIGLLERARAELGESAMLVPSGGNDFLLYLEEDAVLGDALADIMRSGISILSCSEERSGAEDAFLRVVGRA